MRLSKYLSPSHSKTKALQTENILIILNEIKLTHPPYNEKVCLHFGPDVTHRPSEASTKLIPILHIMCHSTHLVLLFCHLLECGSAGDAWNVFACQSRLSIEYLHIFLGKSIDKVLSACVIKDKESLAILAFLKSNMSWNVKTDWRR